MAVFIKKCLLFFISVVLVVVSGNYLIDPANIFHYSMIPKIVAALHEGKIVYHSGNLDEGKLQEEYILAMENAPKTVIIGSSHVMYEPWPFDGVYIAGMSGAYLGDYYGIIGVLESCDKLPQRVVIGIDSWSFMRGARDGRHSSLSKYAKYAYNNVKHIAEGKDELTIETNKIKELFSLAYFQESVAMLKKNNFHIIREKQEEIDFADNDEIEERAKILPNGRRISAKKGVKDIKENEKTVNEMLKKGIIYQLGTGFKELQLDNLEEFKCFLQYLKHKHVIIEFYLHPWYPAVYQYFSANPNFIGVFKTEKYIRALAKEENIIVHGSFSSEVCGVSEKDYTDWLHLKADKMMEIYNVILPE